jgi:hypothetical protein
MKHINGMSYYLVYVRTYRCQIITGPASHLNIVKPDDTHFRDPTPQCVADDVKRAGRQKIIRTKEGVQFGVFFEHAQSRRHSCSVRVRRGKSRVQECNALAR